MMVNMLPVKCQFFLQCPTIRFSKDQSSANQSGGDEHNTEVEQDENVSASGSSHIFICIS